MKIMRKRESSPLPEHLSRPLLGGLVLAGLIGGGLALFTARTARRVESALPPRGRFVDIDGARIHYLDRGVGPTIVLLHGLAGQMGHFTHSLVDRLADDFRVIVMERPGSGHSIRARGVSARLSAQAETVAGFIRALELERPLLVGHSLGGAVALAVALNHPEQVGGLALIAPYTHAQQAVPAVFRGLAIRSPLLRRLVGWTVATPAAILRQRTVLGAVFAPDAAPENYATTAGGLLALRPRSFVSASEDLMAAGDDMPGLVDRYSSLQIPVGVLFGTGDRILDPREHGESLAAKIPDVEIELIDGGHMLPITAPDEAAALVRRVARRAGFAAG